MEVDKDIFQDLKYFGKERYFKMAIERFWISVSETSKISQNGFSLVLHYAVYAIFLRFTIYNIE